MTPKYDITTVSSMEIPNEEQSDNTIILLQNFIYSYIN